MYQKGMIPSMPEDAARAAYEARLADERNAYGNPVQRNTDMFQGYDPNNVPLPLRAPNGFDRLGQGEAYGQTLQALQEEYQRNEARIAEIEAEIASIEKVSATNLDELDMALAANRAGIGDIGNSFAHTSRIQTRRQLADQAKRDKAVNDRKEVEGIVEQLENAYIMRGSADNVQRADWDNKINRLAKKYKELTGEDYVYTGATPKTGFVNDGVKTIEDYNSFLAGKRDKKGRLSKASIAQAEQFLAGLPLTEEVTKAREDLAKEVSQEQAADDAYKQAKKDNEALDEWEGKIGEATFASEGKNTITRDSKAGPQVTFILSSDGKTVTAKAGKQSRSWKA